MPASPTWANKRGTGGGKLERAMRVSGLDDKEIDNYFCDMMTEKEIRPYIEGAWQQGFRQGFEEGSEHGGHRLDL